MKKLLLIRHAKSSWADFSIKDFDRPLNERGKHDAPMMAKRLLDKKVSIDAFIASPAKRAKKTAELFIKAYNGDKDDIIVNEQLYLAEPPVFFEVISQVSDQHDTIAIFSHNNGITDFANQLTHTRIDELPTCGIFAVKIPIKHWKDFKDSDKEFWFADYPKAGDD
ncbi:MAG: histidine phosphatase family protein [Chitinophagaceae bacterium]|nr:MAG: histidine phosphatase family protein [Chitinophagaceae bacterium]